MKGAQNYMFLIGNVNKSQMVLSFIPSLQVVGLPTISLMHRVCTAEVSPAIMYKLNTIKK